MTEIITRPTECVSRKETWAEDRRVHFEQSLLGYGWVKGQVKGEMFLNRQMPDEIRFVKGDKALFIDDFGAFVFMPNYFDGAWQRTHGISDDEIDKSPQGHLHFCDGPKLDLKSGLWVK